MQLKIKMFGSERLHVLELEKYKLKKQFNYGKCMLNFLGSSPNSPDS